MRDIQLAAERPLAAAIVLQRVFRGHYVRSWIRYQEYHALLIQDVFRMFKERKHAARHLQRLYRGHLTRVWMQKQKASLVVQTRARAWLAMRMMLRARRFVENTVRCAAVPCPLFAAGVRGG